MNKLNTVLTELGVSKVRLAKYLGVSRQMLYNYLALDSLEDWPKEKAVKLLSLLNIKDSNELNDLEIDGDYIRLTNKGLDFANIVWKEFV